LRFPALAASSFCGTECLSAACEFKSSFGA
jgi:hypothetical protein